MLCFIGRSLHHRLHDARRRARPHWSSSSTHPGSEPKPWRNPGYNPAMFSSRLERGRPRHGNGSSRNLEGLGWGGAILVHLRERPSSLFRRARLCRFELPENSFGATRSSSKPEMLIYNLLFRGRLSERARRLGEMPQPASAHAARRGCGSNHGAGIRAVAWMSHFPHILLSGLGYRELRGPTNLAQPCLMSRSRHGP